MLCVSLDEWSFGSEERELPGMSIWIINRPHIAGTLIVDSVWCYWNIYVWQLSISTANEWLCSFLVSFYSCPSIKKHKLISDIFSWKLESSFFLHLQTCSYIWNRFDLYYFHETIWNFTYSIQTYQGIFHRKFFQVKISKNVVQYKSKISFAMVPSKVIGADITAST